MAVLVVALTRINNELLIFTMIHVPCNSSSPITRGHQTFGTECIMTTRSSLSTERTRPAKTTVHGTLSSTGTAYVIQKCECCKDRKTGVRRYVRKHKCSNFFYYCQLDTQISCSFTQITLNWIPLHVSSVLRPSSGDRRRKLYICSLWYRPSLLVTVLCNR
jgi:hypothetical protein